MPTAGDEGYEDLIICPYDKAHEIRRGKMQFHLVKCRENFPNSPLVECLFNSTHRVPKIELQYHVEHECQGRSDFERSLYEVGDTNCPVANLVSVNSGTLPESEENWDDYEAKGSVLDNLKQQAEEKPIFRMKQCAPRSERKAFRRAEQLRMERIQRESSSSMASTPAPSLVSEGPLRRPKKPLAIPVEAQDPKEAMAAICSGMNKTTTSVKPFDADLDSFDNRSDVSPSYTTAASEVSSVADEPPTRATNYASASKLVSKTEGSSNSSRPSTAMSIAASANRARSQLLPPSSDGFCPVQIPGLGRGRRTKQ